MARVAGIEISNEKRLWVSLLGVYGVGEVTAKEICAKGQKSRSGHKSLESFEGGNVPFFRRMPKYKGFNNKFKVETQVVNTEVLAKNFDNGETVTIDILKEKGIIKKNAQNVKILAKGEIEKKLKIEGINMSPSARAKIEKAGGTII